LMAILFYTAGTVLIIAGLRDLFQTVFHPASSGVISDWIARGVWRVFQSMSPRRLVLAGPFAFLMTVLYWGISLVVGFAIIYRPLLPRAFLFTNGLDEHAFISFRGAVDLSLNSLMTQATGVYPRYVWLQLLMGAEAVLGFALLTASISWILSIYPVLEHRRSLAHEATLLHFSEEKGVRRLDEIGDVELTDLLLGFVSQVTTHRNELTQFPITYYFYEEDSNTAIAGILPYLADIAQQNVQRAGAAAIAATSLGGAVDEYLKVIAKDFLHCAFPDREQILLAYAQDQRRGVVRAPSPRPRKAA
jgi:hypothetical protein